MQPRNLVFITLLALCHLQLGGQALTNALPLARSVSKSDAPVAAANLPDEAVLPDDPGQEALPLAQPEPVPSTGIPVDLNANHQSWGGNIWTGVGNVEVHYRGYTIRADKVTYNRATALLEAEGHLQVTGGPEDVLINASHGDMRLDMHTARFYNVAGSMGLRRAGRTVVYSTANPFLFEGRVLLQNGEGNYKIIDGSMTNCRLPKPDWRLISRSISLADGTASTTNALFKFLGVPLFYLPYLRHPVDATGRESGFLIPVPSNSSIKGFVLGEQAYWVINRSMDMVIGTEYYSKRGWAPNGDFRYKGPGFDHVTARWNALFDRGLRQLQTTGPQAGTLQLVNQGGTDILAFGRKDLTSETRAVGSVEYLSSYVYRLVFNENYAQAISSEVASDLSLTHTHNGIVPSISIDRFQSFASTTNGDEVRILRLPSLRFDLLDRSWVIRRCIGDSVPPPATWAVPSPVFMLTTWAALICIRISHCRWWPAAGAWCPKPPCAAPSTPAARPPISLASITVSPPSATIPSFAPILRLRWMCGRRPWSATSRSAIGTASCAT